MSLPGLTPFARIGDVSITRIEESVRGSLVPEKVFAGFDPDSLERHRDWLMPNHYDPATGRFLTSVHSFLVRTPHHTVLIDTCGGNGKDRPYMPRFHQAAHPWLERLAAAGVTPDQVDQVICTHLHCDHVGWNTQRRDGRWVPTFPNARYLFHRPELARWNPANPPLGAGAPHDSVWEDSIAPVIDAGLAVEVDSGHAVDDTLTIEAAPGHTMGHVRVMLASGGAEAVFCGDVLHVPLQVYYPDWTTRFDDAPELGIVSRRAVLDYCAERGALLMPTHFAAPHRGFIRRQGEGYRIEWGGVS